MALFQRANASPTARYQQLYDLAKRARYPFDRETWLNIAFYLGEQYIEWSNSANAIRRIPRPSGMQHQPRVISNKIKHFVLQEHSLVLKTRPSVDVLPASEDPMDISNANVALAYLNWLSDDQVTNFDAELAEAALWALCSTEGYLKWIWNPRIDNGKGRGDIIACSPLDVYPDPYVKRFDRARYVFHSQFMDTEQVYDIYGIEVKPSDVDKADPVKVALQREMGMAPILTGVNVVELWMKPNRRYPKGMFVVWSHDNLLVPPAPYPYDHGMLPFTQLGSVPRPGTSHYTSAVSDLRNPQMEVNKFHSQMVKVRESFSSPKWWLPAELELESDPDDSPNQILRGHSTTAGLKPEIIQPSGMPATEMNGQWLTQEMMDIVGLHEVSQGQVPGRVEAAKAIELLQEGDSGRLAELLRTIKSSISNGYYMQLMLAKQFMTAEQVVVTYSAQGMPEVKRLMKDALKPGLRIRVTMGTGLSNSRAARTDQLMLMWDSGIIQDQELMAELLEIPVSSVSPSNAYDIRLARNENLTMADGVPIVPNSWDNHDIHRREHNNYRKTQEFLELPTKVKTMFEFHVQMHDQLQIQQLGKQLQIQQMAAAVSQGAGFQMGGAPGAPQQGGPGPNPGAAPGHQQPQATHQASMRNAMRGQMPSQVPQAAGAQQQRDVMAVRNSPQGAASYQNRYENDLHHPHL